MLPNLRIPPPGRTDINEDTIVEQDLTDGSIEFTKWLARLDIYPESKYIGMACSQIDKNIHLWQMMKKRLRGEQYALNEKYRKADEQRRKEALGTQ